MQGPLYVTFLWHMHQPYYKNIENNKFILPWVRMHAVKDYYDMVSILDRYPAVKQNFNLVPSLLLQIEEYIAGATDIFMDMTLKAPEELNDDEKVFILFNFFMANWNTMIYPYPRYAELLEKRGENTNPDEIKGMLSKFDSRDIRDLQVWFNLAWIDTDFFAMYPELNAIKEKGEDFTEEEKRAVIDSHIKIMKLIIPKYKEAQEAGRVELSTTPFYHPILPLVADTETAKICMPGIPLDFRFSHPGDASAQVKKGLEYFESRFGRRPAGMWPSEGSVSPAVMEILAENGVKWAATDENILKKSLEMAGQPVTTDTIYRPYECKTEKGNVMMAFRSLHLSDLIGFNYQNWKAEDAAANFIHELHQIRNKLDGGPYAVNIILDGENCWEYYYNDGKSFLNALYEGLSREADIKCVHIGELEGIFSDKPAIEKIYPGSWINHDFYIWIGHEEDKKSWKLLQKVRDDLAAWESQNQGEGDKLSKAWESLYIAEGSDWNWWYGDDHSSRNDNEFDNLYRLHLMNVYRAIGLEIPAILYEPIKRGETAFDVEPSMMISPDIDGRITDFYEWKGAGVYDLSKQGGAMHKADLIFESMHYGFDFDRFYIRLDPAQKEAVPGAGFAFSFKWADRQGKASFLNGVKSGEGINADAANFSMGAIFEASFCFSCFENLNEDEPIWLKIEITKAGSKAEDIPSHGYLKIMRPDRHFISKNWKA